MKKIVVLLLLITCLFSGTASAEEITLPNGLQFGMDISEAVAVSSYQRSQLTDSDKTYYKAYGFSFLDDCITQKVVIGGIEAEMLVLFDMSGLRQIRYRFLREEVDKSQANKPGESIKNSHKTVEDSLQQKYGDTLDPVQNRHMYMPPVGQYVSWSYTGYIFGVKYDFSYTATALLPTLRIVKMDDGSSVCIDNYVKAQTNGVQYHELTYTYYDFMVNNNNQTNSIGF